MDRATARYRVVGYCDAAKTGYTRATEELESKARAQTRAESVDETAEGAGGAAGLPGNKNKRLSVEGSAFMGMAS